MKKIVVFLAGVLILASCNKIEMVDDNYVLGSGELTHESVILQCRFAASDTLVNYDMPGVSCKGLFQFSKNSLFEEYTETEIQPSSVETDYMIKTLVDGLEPGARYYYRAKAIMPDGEEVFSRVGSFKTFVTEAQSQDVEFAIATGFNYEQFYGLDSRMNERNADTPRKLGATGADSILGFEAFESVEALNLDFFIANGDVVYYDKPGSNKTLWALTADEMRAKWHRYFTMPRNRDMCLYTPVYYLKDDHDHRYNDCDTTGSQAPSSQLGIDIFREQVPVVDPTNPDDKTYRTVRMGKDLQLWFVEGRDFRSPNNMPDTPEKTIWGKEQKEWLMRTLAESDATFKLLISPTPMIGPDDAYKEDNHTNPGGFQSERDEFFAFLEKEDLIGNGFYIICGDRHWQYHSIAPNGIEEFSCGAFVDQNSRAGRAPGDPKSTDPEALIEVPFLQLDDNWGGGFLHVALTSEASAPKLKFSFKDKYGAQRYEVTKSREIVE